MNREVPFDKDAKCDVCGSRGAYDFMGDYLCGQCAQRSLHGRDHEQDINRDFDESVRRKQMPKAEKLPGCAWKFLWPLFGRLFQ